MAGALIIVSVAAVLVAVPTWLLAWKVYGPASAGCALEIVSVRPFAPLIRPPFVKTVPLSRQMKVSGALPLALAMKDATEPAIFVALCGCAVTAGGAITVTTATA